MNFPKTLRVACMLGLLGCTSAPLAGDDADATFGGNAVKADGSYEECVVLEVLEFVNEATTTSESLQALGLRANAADNIIAHRMGPDGALWLLTDSPRGKVYRMVPVQ